MNNKYLTVATVALFAAMSSCSDERLSISTGNESSGVPIEFGRTTMASLSTRAQYDETDFDHSDADIERIGIYCLARDIVGRNEQAQDIDWWNTDEYHITCGLLRNVPAQKIGYDIEWERGTYYYPISQFYAYDFYAYYPYSNTPNERVKNEVSVPISIDGQTDVLWGRATNNFFDYAYSAKYIREHSVLDETDPAYGQIKDDKWLPSLRMNHMLTKLIFRFTPGEFAVNRDIQIVDIQVREAHDALRLYVANLTRDAAYTTGWLNSLLMDDEISFDSLTRRDNAVMWTTDNRNEMFDRDLRNNILNECLQLDNATSKSTFHLCENEREHGFDPTVRGNLDPTSYCTHPADPATAHWPQRIGGCILVYPWTFYKVYVTLREKLDYVPDDLHDPVAAGELPKYVEDGGEVWRLHYTEQPLYVYLTKDTTGGRTGEDVFTERFKPSYQYYVDLTINYPTRIELKAVVEDWDDAEKNPVSIEL